MSSLSPSDAVFLAALDTPQTFDKLKARLTCFDLKTIRAKVAAMLDSRAIRTLPDGRFIATSTENADVL